MAPPMSSHMVLSVGFPVKKRETPEAVESEALTPQMMRMIPPTTSASEMGLFMIFDRLVVRGFRFFEFELGSEHSGGFFVRLHQALEKFGGVSGAPALHGSVYGALLNTWPGPSGHRT
jgi:hypothetical protein